MGIARRLVIGCAAIGFLLPIAMLGYYTLSNTGAGEAFVRLCPTCMASMALDHSSFATAIIVWFFICLSNAVLYAIPALLVLIIVSFGRRS